MAALPTSRHGRAVPVDGALARESTAPGVRTVRFHRTRARTTGVLLVVLLGFLLLLLVLGALAHANTLVILTGILLPVTAVGLLRLLLVALPRHRDVVQAQVLLPLLTQDALVLAVLLETGELSENARTTVILCLVLIQGLRFAFVVLAGLHARQVAVRVGARNLPGSPPSLPDRPWVLTTGGMPTILLASAALPAAMGFAVWRDSYGVVSLAAGLAVLSLLAVVVRSAAAVLTWHRRAKGQVPAVHAAALRHEPLVILYSAGGPDDLYWINQWLDTLEHLPRKSLIMLRDPDAFDLLRPTSVPIVCLPNRFDIGPFRLPTAKVSLFVAHGTENMRLLRSRTLRSAYIGHGDSDKGVSASPFHRAYEERWVAGEAARQRFLAADLGLRADGIRIVGRPQVRRVRRAVPAPTGGRYSVLYAPSWEGVERRPDESSLLHSGLEIVQTLLARGDVRLVYRPHPKTGERNPAFVARHHEIVALLEQAGQPHRLDEPHTSDVIESMNSVDALIADRSGVLSDFLASDKPYFVVNASGLSDDDFRAAYTSVRGAYLLGPGGTGLDAALADARGADSRRDERRATRTALLGPAVEDALAPFVDAIDALASTLPTPGQVPPAGPGRPTVPAMGLHHQS